MTLNNALQQLHVHNDAHWTKDGLPVLAVVGEFYGQAVTRADLPKDFNRFTAAAYPWLDPIPEATQIPESVLAVAVQTVLDAPAKPRLLVQATGLPATPEQIAEMEAVLTRVSERNSERFAIQAKMREVETAIADYGRGIAELEAQINDAENELAELHDSLDKIPYEGSAADDVILSRYIQE